MAATNTTTTTTTTTTKTSEQQHYDNYITTITIAASTTTTVATTASTSTGATGSSTVSGAAGFTGTIITGLAESTQFSGTTTTQTLNDFAAETKQEADKASAEIAAASAAINAVKDASSKLDTLDLNKFSRSVRFKREKSNNHDVRANVPVEIDQSSGSVSSSSAYPVPTTCTSLLKLMDDITVTLTNNPVNVTPLMDALLAITTPLVTPCSADDINKLSAKKNTAKSTATAAVAKQTNLKAAAIDRYNAANKKLKLINEEIAVQGGSTIAAGTAAPTVATMSTAPGANYITTTISQQQPYNNYIKITTAQQKPYNNYITTTASQQQQYNNYITTTSVKHITTTATTKTTTALATRTGSILLPKEVLKCLSRKTPWSLRSWRSKQKWC